MGLHGHLQPRCWLVVAKCDPLRGGEPGAVPGEFEVAEVLPAGRRVGGDLLAEAAQGGCEVRCGDAGGFGTPIGGQLAGALVTLLLASALAFNLSMLPYVLWFKAAMPAALAVACLCGIRYGLRAPTPAEAGSAAPGPGR
jgi:hypothetical protein